MRFGGAPRVHRHRLAEPYRCATGGLRRAPPVRELWPLRRRHVRETSTGLIKRSWTGCARRDRGHETGEFHHRGKILYQRGSSASCTPHESHSRTRHTGKHAPRTHGHTAHANHTRYTHRCWCVLGLVREAVSRVLSGRGAVRVCNTFGLGYHARARVCTHTPHLEGAVWFTENRTRATSRRTGHSVVRVHEPTVTACFNLGFVPKPQCIPAWTTWSIRRPSVSATAVGARCSAGLLRADS